MQTKTNMDSKAHAGSQTLNQPAASGGLKQKTQVKGGGVFFNHNQATSGGLKQKSRTKAGGLGLNHNQAASSRVPAQ